jgi:hypothetical protein
MNSGASFSDWVDAFRGALTDMLSRIGNYIPNIVGAALIILIGWIVGIFLGGLVERLLKMFSIQKIFEKARIEDLLKKAEIKTDTSALIGALVKWVVLIVSFISAADVLQLNQISAFLNTVLGYIPNVVAAVGIVVVGIIAAQFFGNVIKATLKVTNLGFAELASAIVKWSVIIFSFLAALYQLQVAQGLIQTIFMGFVALIAIAGGLAFGLGGQDSAKEILGKIKKEFK